ncbi:hypothetical protein CPB86DRAFT_781763 [Serendipita vermifera]|nr:hypothetical protein CPB86DRAFT_781763 [Serendipita vermifera]
MDNNKKHASLPLNDKLPFEILFIIFDHYSEWDGPIDPLEKLLWICKSWSSAAKEHKTLWASFHIQTFAKKSLHFWSLRMSDRINRCGGTTLLDLSFQYLRDMPTEGKQVDLNLQVTKLLIGENSSPVALGSSFVSTHTPNFRDFQAGSLVLTEPILPFAPLLEHFAVSECSFELSSTLKQLRTLEGDLAQIRNLDASLYCNRITCLRLVYCDISFHSPFHFPLLAELSLEGPLEEDFLEWFSAPRLLTLKIRVDTPWDVMGLAGCEGIVFHQLIMLHLDCEALYDPECTTTITGLSAIIRASTNVDRFRVVGYLALRILLLSLQEAFDSGLQRRMCTIEATFSNSHGVNTISTIDSEAGLEDINNIRKFHRLPLSDTWGSIESWEFIFDFD